jgi:hypothetical protein
VDVDADVEREDEDAVADAFVVGRAVAACAIALPPPMRVPETASATSALRSWCRMIDHLLRSGRVRLK